jgi:hypothetical protein
MPTATQQIDYPVEFVERVKAAYPDFPELHEHLAKGFAIVGRYLNDNQFGVSSQAIVDAFEDDELKSSVEKLAELKKLAEKALERDALYTEWVTIYQDSGH